MLALTGGKYILRYFYKISSIQILKTGHEKIDPLFCFGDSNGDPDRKTDTICALDIKDHVSAKMLAAEESRLVLGTE